MQRKLCPDTETIEHTCLNTLCVNPNHMLVATRSDNSSSGNARRWGFEDRSEMLPLRRKNEENYPWDPAVPAHPEEIPF